MDLGLEEYPTQIIKIKYKMITYQVFRGDRSIAENVSVNDLHKYITAGARLISGNRYEKGVLMETRATYILREGGTITFVQTQSKSK